MDQVVFFSIIAHTLPNKIYIKNEKRDEFPNKEKTMP